MRVATEYTDKGLRVIVEVVDNLVVLSCQTQAMTAPGKVLEKMPWLLARLGFPTGTLRHEAERMVGHWLSFHCDDALTRDGVGAFREVFASLKETSPSALRFTSAPLPLPSAASSSSHCGGNQCACVSIFSMLFPSSKRFVARGWYFVTRDS